MTRMNIRQAKNAANVTKAMAVPTSVYDQRLGDINYPTFQAYPHCIFFYYIYKNSSGFYNVIHYYSPGTSQPLTTRAQVKAKVEELVTNARIPNEADRRPPPIGEKWKYAVWDRKSYLAIFIDDPSVVLVPPAIEFTQRPGSDDTYNYSFFDAWNDTIGNRPVIFCVNHMKMDDPGNDLNFDAQYFHFDLSTNPPLRFAIAYPDSGGTNMGPPVPPP